MKISYQFQFSKKAELDFTGLERVWQIRILKKIEFFEQSPFFLQHISIAFQLFLLDQSIKFKLFYNALQKKPLDYPWINLSNVSFYDFKIPNRLFFVSARYFDQPKIDKLLKGVDVYFNPHFFPAPVSDGRASLTA